MSTESEPIQSRPGGGLSLIFSIVIVAVAAFILAMVMRQTSLRPRAMGKAPEIKAAGWLNGSAPSPEDLKGKVIVLDAWAYWCGPCRRAAPELVELHEKYRDKGVVFIGLTTEGAEHDEENRKFLEATKITWPNGYGAVETMIKLKADMIPQRWVIDRNNNLIWDEWAKESIESAIDRALAENQTP